MKNRKRFRDSKIRSHFYSKLCSKISRVMKLMIPWVFWLSLNRTAFGGCYLRSVCNKNCSGRNSHFPGRNSSGDFWCMFILSVLCGSGITVCFLPGIKTRRLHYAATCLAVRNTFPGLRLLICSLLSNYSITRMSANAHPAEGTSFLCHPVGIT